MKPLKINFVRHDLGHYLHVMRKKFRIAGTRPEESNTMSKPTWQYQSLCNRKTFDINYASGQERIRTFRSKAA